MRRLILFSFALALSIYAAPPPSAREILDSVRLLESRQHIDLDGQLREDEKVIPFHLTQTGPLIRYSFSDPEEVLQLRLGENGSRLDLVTETGAETFRAEKLNEKIRGTGISYEDLALKFLYWPNARVLGDETVRTRLLETASSRAFPEFPVLECRYLGRQGERRAYANGSLCLGRKTRETLRSHLCAKDRQPLVPKTDARGRIATGHE
jgi:hypothetical protein